ncbi:MAG TPA: tetratricopeptide repeat protein [Thermoanaerobaculia bacterium]|nr:tetratricopeptide repeat protein [Thermoanaerobaculia bacterium]
MGRKSRSRAARAASQQDLASPPPPPAPAAAGPGISAGIAAALVLLVAVVFLQVRNHQFLGYDDPIYIIDNEQVKRGLTAEGVAWAFRSFDFNWHPVTWITHMIDVELFGLDAGAHLLVNAAIHALNAVLLFLILARATASPWRSAIVAALFAIHPLRVESVAWIAERKDVLSSLFLLLTIWFYLRFVERRSRPAYAAMLLTFILGLMSKGMLVTLPFVLLLLDYWPLRRFDLGDWRTLRRLAYEKLPLFILIVPGAIVTWYAQHAVEAIANVRFVSLPIRLANAAISYVVYMRRMFWPDDLALGYPYPSTIRPSTSLAAALVLLIITFLVFLFRERRYLFTGWFWFAGMLVPVSGIVQIGPQAMADRYTYIPMAGLFIALVWLLGDLVATRPALRLATAVVAAGVIGGLTFAARAQAGYWKDTETLFARTARVTQRNPIAHETLGFAYIRNRDFERALPEFQALLAVRPNYGRGYEGLAASLLGLGRTAEAAEAYRNAIRLDPTSGEARRQLGNLEMAAGRAEEAAALLEQAAELGDREAPGALAIVRGDTGQAIAHYEAAVKENPNSAEARNNLAAALAREGRDEEALAEYRAALKVAPFHYDANMNIGALLSRLDRNNEAISHFVAATRARPQATEPHVYMALVLAGVGQLDDAIAEVERAMSIDAQTANTEFTNAVRLPPKPTNLEEFLATLRAGTR